MSEYLMYLRKSRQDNENETVEQVLLRHEKQLQDYAIATFGYAIPEDCIYREVVSGETIEDRPEINKIFEKMADPHIKGVLVIEPQRLTRGDLLDCGTVVHLFRYSNTLVVTPSKSYNLADKYDRKFLEMELTRGNDYLEYTKEILSRGRSASAHEGYYTSSVAPYGYDRVKTGKRWTLAINETEAPYVRMAFELYVNDGLGAAAIANRIMELGAKPRKAEYINSSTIRQILTNEVYIGKIRWQHRTVVKTLEDGKVVKKRPRNHDYSLIDGVHPSIVSADLFYAAAERKGKITREKCDTTLNNIFAGLIKCKRCGKAIAQRPHRNHSGRARKDRYFCKSGKFCSTMSCNAEDAIAMIIASLKAYMADFKVKMDSSPSDFRLSHDALIKSLERDMAVLDKRQDELYEFLEQKIYTPDVFLKRNEKLAADRDRISSAIKKAQEEIPAADKIEKMYYTLHEALDLLNDPSVSAKSKNMFLKSFIEVIYYTKDSSDGLLLEIVLK